MSVRGDEFIAAWKKLPEEVRGEIAGKIVDAMGWIQSTEKFNESREVRGTTINFGPVPGGCPTCGKI